MDATADALSQAYRRVFDRKTRTAENAATYQDAFGAARETSKREFLAYGVPSDIGATREQALMARGVPTLVRAATRAGETPEEIDAAIERVRARVAEFTVIATMTAGVSRLDFARVMMVPYPDIVPEAQWQEWATDLRAKNYIVAFEPPSRPQIMAVRAPPV